MRPNRFNLQRGDLIRVVDITWTQVNAAQREWEIGWVGLILDGHAATTPSRVLWQNGVIGYCFGVYCEVINGHD